MCFHVQAKGRRAASSSPSTAGSRAERYQRIQKLLGERRAKLELEGGPCVTIMHVVQLPCHTNQEFMRMPQPHSLALVLRLCSRCAGGRQL